MDEDNEAADAISDDDATDTEVRVNSKWGKLCASAACAAKAMRAGADRAPRLMRSPLLPPLLLVLQPLPLPDEGEAGGDDVGGNKGSEGAAMHCHTLAESI